MTINQKENNLIIPISKNDRWPKINIDQRQLVRKIKLPRRQLARNTKMAKNDNGLLKDNGQKDEEPK